MVVIWRAIAAYHKIKAALAVTVNSLIQELKEAFRKSKVNACGTKS